MPDLSCVERCVVIAHEHHLRQASLAQNKTLNLPQCAMNIWNTHKNTRPL